jgi:hypothetical protein
MRSFVASSLVASVVLVGCGPGRTPGGGGGDDDDNGGGGGVTGDVCDIGTVSVAVPEADALSAAGGAPDRACVGNPEQVGASTQLTVEGCVDIFGVGNLAERDTEVAVFLADVDPKTGTPLATGVVAVPNQAATLDGGANCAAGSDANAPACRSLDCGSEGFYRLNAPVPSNTPLTMRITHPTAAIIVDTYVWGVVFRDSDATAGVYEYEAPIIYSSTYDSIPTLSGRTVSGAADLQDGVGNGVIAGEVHDCADVIVENAVVGMTGFDRSTMSTVYFNGEEDPNPDALRTATASDGLYAVLNVPGDVEREVFAGVRDPACAGEDCQCLSLGSRKVKAYADSVSIVVLEGDFPVTP